MYRNKKKDDKPSKLFALILLIVINLFVGGFIGFQSYAVNRDIDSVIDRAQVSADSTKMLKQMETLKRNMEYYGLDRGHGAIIFKTPMNDFGLTYEAVCDIMERLEGLDRLPKDSATYQVGLDDVRGTIRELPNPGLGYVWVHYGWWAMPFGVLSFLGVIFFIENL